MNAGSNQEDGNYGVEFGVDDIGTNKDLPTVIRGGTDKGSIKKPKQYFDPFFWAYLMLTYTSHLGRYLGGLPTHPFMGSKSVKRRSPSYFY